MSHLFLIFGSFYLVNINIGVILHHNLKTMKERIKLLLTILFFIVIGNGIIYLLFSFVCWDLNVSHWNDLPRAFMGFSFLAYTFFSPMFAVMFNSIDD